MEKPYVILVEAKKDNFEEGWGQCLAELIAVQKLNGDRDKKLFGVVSNRKIWGFGLLESDVVTKNIKYFGLQSIEELMGALQRFALKPKPRKILKALLCNAFKIFLVVRLIGHCCKFQIAIWRWWVCK